MSTEHEKIEQIERVLKQIDEVKTDLAKLEAGVGLPTDAKLPFNERLARIRARRNN